MASEPQNEEPRQDKILPEKLKTGVLARLGMLKHPWWVGIVVPLVLVVVSTAGPLAIRVGCLIAALFLSTITFYMTEFGRGSKAKAALAFTAFLFLYGGLFLILQRPWEQRAAANVQIALGGDSVRGSPPRGCGDPVEIHCYSESQLQRPLPLKLYGAPGIAHIIYIITDTGNEPIQDALVRAVTNSPGVLLDITHMPNPRRQDMEMIEQVMPRLEPEKIMHSGIQWSIKVEVVDPRVKLFPNTIFDLWK